MTSRAAAQAAPKPAAPPAKGRPGVPPATPPSPQLQALLDSTAICERDGRYCLARCTEHLAAGAQKMQECQRSIMNMLPVVEAMGAVAGHRNANPKLMAALAATCAQFCRECAATCEPHQGHHPECKACMDACLSCAKACDGLTAA